MVANFSCNRESCCLNKTQMNLTGKCCLGRYKRNLTTETIIIMMNVHVILAIVAVFGSYLVLRAFYKFHSLRTASNIILVSLSAADGLLAIPFILDIIRMALKLSSNVKSRSEVLCMLSACSSFFLITVIILHLALISVERFIAVKFALRYHTIVTKRRALFASITVWLWAVAVMFIFPKALKASSNDDLIRFHQAMHPCSKTHKGPPRDLPPSTRGYLIFLVISLLVIPLVIILCSYGYIFIVSHKHRQQIKEQDNIPAMSTIKHEMKGARTLAIVVAVCLLSIVPLLVVTCLRFFGELPECRHPKLKYIKFIVFDVATGLNAICNPVIYGWRNEEFRSAFRKLLKCA